MTLWPPPRWARIAAVTALPVAAFVAGRLSRAAPPAEVRYLEAEKRHDQQQATAAQSSAAATEGRQAVTAERAKRRRRFVREVTAPDGTKTREVTSDTATHDRLELELAWREWQAAAARVEAARASWLEARRQGVTIAQPARGWGVSVMAGLNAGAVRGDDRRWWLGGSVTHAFVGPLRWGGVLIARPQVGEWDFGLVGEVDF